MNVFMTGGAGYIGSVTAEILLTSGHQVTIYDNLSRGHLAAIPSGARYVNGDIGDRKTLRDALTSGNFDIEHRWQARIENFDSGERAAKTPYYRVVRILLKIIWQKGQGKKEFLLETLTWTPNG